MKSFRIKKMKIIFRDQPQTPSFCSSLILPTLCSPASSASPTTALSAQSVIQMKHLFLWITVKSFQDEDEEWARMCAEELLDKLNEEL